MYALDVVTVVAVVVVVIYFGGCCIVVAVDVDERVRCAMRRLLLLTLLSLTDNEHRST